MFPVVIAFLVIAGWSANHFAAVLVLLREQSVSQLLIDGAFGIYAVGLFPTLILGGVVADRFGSRPAVVIGTIVSAIGNGLLMFWNDNAVLLAGRFIVGLGVVREKRAFFSRSYNQRKRGQKCGKALAVALPAGVSGCSAPSPAPR